MEDSAARGFPASAGFIIDSHVAACIRGYGSWKATRFVLGNRRRFFRPTGFEIGNATGRAQRKLVKKEARPRSRSLPILRCLRILLILSLLDLCTQVPFETSFETGLSSLWYRNVYYILWLLHPSKLAWKIKRRVTK